MLPVGIAHPGLVDVVSYGADGYAPVGLPLLYLVQLLIAKVFTVDLHGFVSKSVYRYQNTYL
jgi:hypothetical protein